MLSEEIIKEIKDDLKSCDDLMYKYTERHFDLSVNTLSYIEQLEQQNKELIAVLIFACLECGYEYGRPYCNNCFYFKKIGKLEKLLQKKWEDIIK